MSSPLLDTIIASLEDTKGENIMQFDVRHLTPLADTMVICSGRSDRQVNALAKNMVGVVKEKLNINVKSLEGMAGGQWVLVDFVDVVVHVMLADVRESYQLEKSWGVRNTP